MGLVRSILDEFNGLAADRTPWETYWRDIANYVLPHTELFDSILSTGTTTDAVNSVIGTPVASRRSKDLYDMTSLWAVERLTAGMLSLKTPETETWHNLDTDDVFGRDASHTEKVALEGLRDYQFRVRSNPKSGFWQAHRAAVKSMCGFGDGWMFIKDNPSGGSKVPYSYEYMPLPELYPGLDAAGNPNRMFRMLRRSALQAVELTGGNVPQTVMKMAEDAKQKHQTVRLLHAVRPRDDMKRHAYGARGAAFASYYIFPDDEFLASESGFYDYPFTRYSWTNSGNRPYSEGPIAYALGEIKSLQVMAQNELIAVQGHLRPAYATAGKNAQRLNLNPGATNPGLITPDGKPLFSPLTPSSRPDFAQAIMEARRNSVRDMMYLNLWQIIVQDTADTATEALIRAQEKGDLLGPVGISMNHGLSSTVDREIGILGRRGAFDSGSPLEMPESLSGRGVAPVFTSPLDRLRRMGELVGIQRLVELVGTLEQVKPGIAARLDLDEIIDTAQEILGAPARVLVDREKAGKENEGMQQMQQTLMSLQAMQAGGQAAQSVGQGTQSLAQGAEMLAASPALKNIAGRVPQIAQQAAGALGGAR